MNILYTFDPEQFTARADTTPPSPCIGICKMDEQKAWCQGCYRTIDEIICWSKADTELKLSIWRDVQKRMWDEDKNLSK